jgi:hypothetical protein
LFHLHEAERRKPPDFSETPPNPAGGLRRTAQNKRMLAF